MGKENKNKGNVPNLRFPGFEGEWEAKKLEEIADKIGDGLHGTPVYVEESDYYFINGNNLVNGKVELNVNTKKIGFDTFATNDKKLNSNTLLISINGTIGNIARYNNEKIMLGKSVGYYNFNNSSDFLYFVLQTKSIQDFFKSELTGSTIKNLSLKTLRETLAALPSQIEQDKISIFLSLIDQRIETQNKIIEELNRLKATVTKKIFLGTLRYKDEDGNDFPEWKKMKLGDIGEVKMCKRIFNDETSSFGEIPFFKIGSFGKQADAFIPRVLYMDYKTRFSFPKIGDILISAAGTIGRTVIYTGEDAYYQDSNIVWIDNDNSVVTNKFLYYILQNVKYNTEGGTIQRLYNSILKSTKFSCPIILEQKKIINILSTIDSKIDIESSFLQTLEQQKKYLLQQMFV